MVFVMDSISTQGWLLFPMLLSHFSWILPVGRGPYYYYAVVYWASFIVIYGYCWNAYEVEFLLTLMRINTLMVMCKAVQLSLFNTLMECVKLQSSYPISTVSLEIWNRLQQNMSFLFCLSSIEQNLVKAALGCLLFLVIVIILQLQSILRLMRSTLFMKAVIMT